MIYYSSSQEYFADRGREHAVALKRSCTDAILNASKECDPYAMASCKEERPC
jgi:hypothetical protein